MNKDRTHQVKGFDEFYSRLSSVRSPTSKRAHEFLCWLTICAANPARRAKRDALIVELGTFRGKSALCIAYGMNLMHVKKKIITVDNYWIESENPERVRETVKNAGYGGGAIQVVDSETSEFAAELEDGSVDLLFIDARHSYRYVCRDLDLYTPKVRLNGIICGDDYSPAEQGLLEAVDDWREMNKSILTGFGVEHHIWWTTRWRSRPKKEKYTYNSL